MGSGGYSERMGGAHRRVVPAPMILARRFLLAASFVVAGAALLPDEARADLRLCNRTLSNVGIAIGYKSNPDWTTEGWWNIAAGTCEVVIQGPLSAQYYYIYAVDYDNGGEWGGKSFMCTREKEFMISGVEDCLTRGFERTGFFEIDTGRQRNWTVQLTEHPTDGVGGQ